MSDFLTAIQKIERAHRPSDLFPPGADHAALHKKFLVTVHPDKAEPKLRSRAEAAFKRVGELFALLKPMDNSKAPVLVGKWVIENTFCAGDIADLYLVRSGVESGVLKIARDKADNDLMAAECAALKALGKGTEYPRYLCKVLDSFEASGRRTTVMSYADGYLPLHAIVEMFPMGMDFRHVVWFCNRLLSLVGYAQRKGYVHGGITPDHLLYHPRSHGLKLVGWGSVTETATAKPIPVLSEDWSALYPPEVPRKRPVHPATDVYMAMACMKYAGDGLIPPRFKALFEHCLAASPSARPVDAWEVQDKWKALASEQYGEPKYVELALPVQ